jgi:hypothetical protein
METLATLESFVRSAETGSFSAAADAFLLAAGIRRVRRCGPSRTDVHPYQRRHRHAGLVLSAWKTDISLLDRFSVIWLNEFAWGRS